MQHLSRFNRIADDGGVERIDQIAHERVAVYRFQRFALARLALALGLDRGGIAADFPDHDLERDGLAEMLLQRGAQLVLVHPVSQMLGRERQAQFHAFAVETAQLALLRELLGDAADLELIGEHRPVAIERLARYARRCRRAARSGNAGPGWGGRRYGRAPCARGFRLFFCSERRRNGALLYRSESEHAHQAHAEARILIRRKRQVATPVPVSYTHLTLPTNRE